MCPWGSHRPPRDDIWRLQLRYSSWRCKSVCACCWIYCFKLLGDINQQESVTQPTADLQCFSPAVRHCRCFKQTARSCRTSNLRLPFFHTRADRIYFSADDWKLQDDILHLAQSWSFQGDKVPFPADYTAAWTLELHSRCSRGELGSQILCSFTFSGQHR